jgi:hypothetical protein
MTEDAARLNTLRASFPRLFSKPLPWGLEVGDGWIPLIELLCARIDTILNEAPAVTFEVTQVKEKFGQLRFYYRLKKADEAMSGAIRQAVQTAQAASIHCCERCGARGQLINTGAWLRTQCSTCDEH